MGRRAKHWALALLVGAVVAAPVLGLAAPAQAHNYLVDSTPKASSTLTTLPADFTITTNDTLLDLDKNNSGFALQVKDSAGRYYGDGCVSVKGATMSTAAAIGAAGTYTVVWQVVSTDGHPVSDSFTFTWTPAAGQVASAGSTKVPDCNGTITVGSADPAPSGPSRNAEIDGGTLATVLWIGGAVLAVGLAVVITILATSRRKKS